MFNPMGSKIDKAAEDMKFLLDRGYNRTRVLDMVTDRYHLGKDQRNHLERFVFSQEGVEKRKNKLVSLDEIEKEKIVVDGYNILITMEAYLQDEKLIRGMDGLTRDNCRVFSNYCFDEETEEAVDEILSILKKASPSYVLFVFDSQISKSGELSAFVRKRIKYHGLQGDARAVKNADREIKELNWVTVSSDRIIVDHVDKVLDLFSFLK